MPQEHFLLRNPDKAGIANPDRSVEFKTSDFQGYADRRRKQRDGGVRCILADFVVGGHALANSHPFPSKHSKFIRNISDRHAQEREFLVSGSLAASIVPGRTSIHTSPYSWRLHTWAKVYMWF